MNDVTLSVFVDESGNFKLPDRESRFYIIGMVIHDQSIDIASEIARLERSDYEIGLEGHCFHAGPLIRKEKGYEILSRKFRGQIFSRMMAFASHAHPERTLAQKHIPPRRTRVTSESRTLRAEKNLHPALEPAARIWYTKCGLFQKERIIGKRGH